MRDCDPDYTAFRLFYGYWPATATRPRTNLVVEQVSHHPPITAYYITVPEKGLTLTGHSAQKTSFSGMCSIFAHFTTVCLIELVLAGSIIVKQIGHAVLNVKLPSGQTEQFLITLPRLRIDGLWYGSPYIELTDTSYIQSSSGWLSTVSLSVLPFYPQWPVTDRIDRLSTKARDTSAASRISSRLCCHLQDRTMLRERLRGCGTSRARRLRPDGGLAVSDSTLFLRSWWNFVDNICICSFGPIHGRTRPERGGHCRACRGAERVGEPEVVELGREGYQRG